MLTTTSNTPARCGQPRSMATTPTRPGHGVRPAGTETRPWCAGASPNGARPGHGAATGHLPSPLPSVTTGGAGSDRWRDGPGDRDGPDRSRGSPGRPSRPGRITLDPASAYEAITRQMVDGLREDVAEIKGRLNGLLWLMAGAIAIDVVLRLAGT